MSVPCGIRWKLSSLSSTVLKMKLIWRTFDLSKPFIPKFTSSRFHSVAAEALDPYQEEEMKKKLIIVNENDEIIGQDTKYNCHRVRNGRLPIHRAFSVFIFNSKNEILLQQRAPCKVTFPNHITNACCSHPLYSTYIYRDFLQTMQNCVSRRLWVELGIPRGNFNTGALKYITKIHYFSKGDGTWGENEIDYIFVLHKDVEVRPSSMEVKQVWSVPRNEFNNFIKSCEYPLTPWFSIIMKEWLFKIWDNLHDLQSIRDDVSKIHRYN